MRLQNWGEEMYLSRIRLDAANRNTLRALAAPQKLHGALESAFSGPRKRNLWRIDSLNGDLYILLLSEEIPDLSGFCRQYCRTADDAQTKQYDGLLVRITAGSVWHFRLTANPVKSQKKENTRGKVLAHITADHQKHHKPDLRSERWTNGSAGDKFVCIEIEVPDEQVLLSDFDSWELVLLDALISETEAEDHELDRFYQKLSSEKQREMKYRNWERVFDISPLNNDWILRGWWIQATFWVLTKDMIRKVRYFTAARRSTSYTRSSAQ